MARIAIILAVAGLAAGAPVTAQDSVVTPPVSHPSERRTVPGPAANFTGHVMVEALVQPAPPGRAALGLVTFAPGARSNWHTHPAGQSLYVTDGCGRTQREGGPVTRICKGDVAYVPAGVRHWHGATETTAMTHLAVSEAIGERNVDWTERVTDAQYHVGETN